MTNRLACETSLYLRQHAANPVDWYSWGDLAFQDATRLQKPILVSIGYASCHWCHVMARESFTDPRIAAIMNERFVNVKVDREERPDVDAIHIRAMQAMGRRSGWPLTIFLTPSGKPFWGGTYFPPEERHGLPAFQTVLEEISERYRSDRISIVGGTGELAARLSISPTPDAKGTIGKPEVVSAVADLLAHIDPSGGGLKGSSKFPYCPLLRFLWNSGLRNNNPAARNAVLLTLDKIVQGGLHDHVGGGFYRYTTDPKWRIPHFEKMLCDNALLIGVLTDVWRSTKNPSLHDAVTSTAEWLLREMQTDGGAFAASVDAESDGAEGAFYLWNGGEPDRTLGDRAAAFRNAYALDSSGCFTHGKVLIRKADAESLPAAEREALAEDIRTLRATRAKRNSPRRDDKILADWNGLAIAALAEAAMAFDEPRWRDAAETAFGFVTDNLAEGGRLFHSWNGGRSDNAILDDYANMAAAALSLHEATGSERYLQKAQEWVEIAIALFRDFGGAFYFTPADASHLVIRLKEASDTVTPSGNGTMSHVLAKLYFLTGEDRYGELARALFRSFAGAAASESFQLATLLEGYQFLTHAMQVTVVGARTDSATQALLKTAYRSRLDTVISWHDPNEKLPAGHPAAEKKLPDGRAAAFVCVGSTCSLPIFDPNEFCRTLEVREWT